MPLVLVKGIREGRSRASRSVQQNETKGTSPSHTGTTLPNNGNFFSSVSPLPAGSFNSHGRPTGTR